MANLLKANGTVEEDVSIKTLKDMQSLVGGYIEFVYTTKDKVLIVNEEGLLTALPLNQTASDIAEQTIVGDVIEVSMDEYKNMV